MSCYSSMAFDTSLEATHSDIWAVPPVPPPMPEFTRRDVAAVDNVVMCMRICSVLLYLSVLVMTLPPLFLLSSRHSEGVFMGLLILLVSAGFITVMLLLARWLGRAATAFQQSQAGWSTLATGFRELRKCFVVFGAHYALHALLTLVTFAKTFP